MEIADFAKLAIGVPFRPHMCDYNGWDCWGLIVMAYQELYNIDLPRWSGDYNDERHYSKINELVATGKIEWNLVKTPDIGDVAIIYMRGRPIHIGLIIDKRRILHVEKEVNTCIQKISTFRIEGYYKHDKFINKG